MSLFYSFTVVGIGLSMTSGLGETPRILKALLPLPSGFQCNCWVSLILTLAFCMETLSSPWKQELLFPLCYEISLWCAFILFSLRTHVPQCGRIILKRSNCDSLPSIFCIPFFWNSLFGCWTSWIGLLVFLFFPVFIILSFCCILGHFSQLYFPA